MPLPNMPTPTVPNPGGDFMGRIGEFFGLKPPKTKLPTPTPGAQVELGPRRTQYEVKMPGVKPRQVAPPVEVPNIGIGGPATGAAPPAAPPAAPETPAPGTAESSEIDATLSFVPGNGGGGGAVDTGQEDPFPESETIDMEGTTITASPGGWPMIWIVAGIAALYLLKKR